jgi:hypothetical protein
VVHLSEADAGKWSPLLRQVDLARLGASRPTTPSIADGYECAVGRLRQPQKHLTDDEIGLLVATYRGGSTILELAAQFTCDRKTVIRYLKLNCWSCPVSVDTWKLGRGSLKLTLLQSPLELRRRQVAD